jgi:hypothetical protein
MSSYEAVNKASKSFQKQITEAEEKIGETTRQVQNEWAKAFEEMSRTVMSRASAEMQLGLKLSQKLTACRSPLDAVSVYQEWATEEMNARSEAAQHFMANCQKFFTESTRLLSNGGMSR